MYHFRKKTLKEGRSCRFTLYRNEDPLSFEEFISLIQDSVPFRFFYIDLLQKQIPFGVYRWETPPVSQPGTDRLFEFVVTESHEIDLPADPGPFHSYFKELADSETVAVFENLGGDARLIAPEPDRPQRNYSHIEAFTKTAPLQLQHDLWRKVGEVMEKQLSDRPIWLNTAGGGVAWLHIRLDSSPKYYRHRPYADDVPH